MLEILRKAFWIAVNRPTAFYSTLRQFFLFSLTYGLQKIVFTESSGICLKGNVRLQRIRCLLAERPHARIEVGEDSIIYENARIEAYDRGTIYIGAGSIIGDARIYARASIRLGKRVVTSWNVFIQDFDPHPVDPDLRRLQMERMTGLFRPFFGRRQTPVPELPWSFPAEAIEIGDDVWIGANATILKGARIGSGSIVATGAVVTAGTYPPRSILAGMPAKVVKSI